MIGDADHPAHEPEEYVVRIGFHRDASMCIVLEYPAHMTPDEAREVLTTLGELATIGPEMIAVTPSGHLVTQRRSGQ